MKDTLLLSTCTHKWISSESPFFLQTKT